jgi:hypothetical protein
MTDAGSATARHRNHSVRIRCAQVKCGTTNVGLPCLKALATLSPCQNLTNGSRWLAETRFGGDRKAAEAHMRGLITITIHGSFAGLI